MRERLEYAAVWTVLKILGRLPRPVARSLAGHLAAVVFRLQPAWRRAALFNLSLAFPEWQESQRELVVREHGAKDWLGDGRIRASSPTTPRRISNAS